MSWQAVTKSATGVKNTQIGQPCQEFGDFETIHEGEIIIAAISDGMGSCKHSEIGSKLAVKETISELKKATWKSHLKDEKYIRNLFMNILEKVRFRLKKEAENNGYSFQDLACTLIAFIATPQQLAAMQIGDGFIVIRSESNDYQLLFKPDKGEFANQTTSITSSEALREMQVCLKSIPYKFICAATDGIENISLIKAQKWKPFINFFTSLEKHMLSSYTLEQKQKKLDDFLNSERINQNTDDDKTLLLCVYQDSLFIDNHR